MANTKIYTSSTVQYYNLRIVLTETGTSVSNNTSTVQYDLYIDAGSTYFSTVKVGAKVVIDGTTVLNRAYSSSSQYSCERNSSVKIATGTTTISHGSDGKKSITASSISATCSSAGIVPTITVTGSGNAWELTDIARASSVSISTNTTILGQARTITITKSDSTYRHKLYYKFSTQSSYTAITSSYITGTTQSFTPPASLSSLVPTNSKSATGTIKCETFTSSGTTVIGTSTCTFTGTIPATTPTLSGGTWIGDALTINMSSRASSSLTHTLTYKFATQTSATTIVSGNGDSSYTWTPTSTQKKNMVQAVATDNASGSGTITCTTYNGTATVGSTTKTWTGKIPASTASVSNSAITMGGSKTFTVSPSGSNLTHKITYEFYQSSTLKTSGTVGTGITTSKTWTVPTSLASQLSNASSGTVKTKILTYNGTVQCGSAQSISSDFTANAPASTMSLSATSVAMGTGTLTITINRATTNMTHLVEYKFNTDADSAYATIASSAGDSATWNSSSGLAYDRASKIPSATSGTWTIRLTTKIGTATVGSAVTKNVTLTVPNNSTTQPSIASVSYAPYPTNASPSGHSNFDGMYIVGMSKVKATFTPTTKYSATIPSKGAVLNVGGASAASGTVTSGNQLTLTATKALTTSGTVKANVKVTDSRGYYKQTSDTSLTAYSYSEPVVTPKSGATKVVCGRSNSSGTLASNGTYLHIEAGRTIASLNSKNYGSLECKLYNASGTLITSAYLLSGTNTASESVTWTSSSEIVSDTTVTYRVEIIAHDRFGNDTTYSVNIPTDSITMDFRPGGKGVGIGMYAQANRVDIAWPTYIDSGFYPRVINSHDAGASSGYYTRMLVAPRYTADDILSGTPDTTPPYETYFRAWLTKICHDYGLLYGAANLLVMGVVQPSIRFLAQGNIYDVSDTVSGLPRHCSFVAYPEGAGMTIIRFGTYEGTWYAEEYVPNGVKTGTLTYVSNNVITSAANLGMTLKKSGKVVTLNATSTTVAGVSASSLVTVANLPSGFYPSGVNAVVTAPQQATTAGNIISLYATTDGLLRVIKIGTSTAAWRATLMWITA